MTRTCSDDLVWLDQHGQIWAQVERKDGLTEEEGQVMDHLTSAVQAMAELDSQHPEEWDEFIRGIHLCQDLLAVRVCRRSFPDGWPIIAE